MTDAWQHTGHLQRVHFGPGAVNRVEQVLREVGARSWLVVSTAGRMVSDDGRRLLGLLDRVRVTTFDRTTSPLGAELVEAAVRHARSEGVEGVISFGGATCADLAKAVCFFAEHEAGTPGVSAADRPVVPHVAVPTTFAPCAFLPSFAMTDRATRRTQEAAAPTLVPVAVVCDPDVTVAGTGLAGPASAFVSLAAAVEVLSSPAATPEAQALAVAAVAVIGAALAVVVDDPADTAGRARLLEGAVLAGRARQNAGAGLHHALASLVAARAGVAYGPVAAVLLAPVMRFNGDAVPSAMHRVGAALGDADDAAAAVDRLRERTGLPASLTECGVDPFELEAVAALAGGHAAVRGNPRPAGEGDARAILEGAC